MLIEVTLLLLNVTDASEVQPEKAVSPTVLTLLLLNDTDASEVQPWKA